MPHTLVDQPQRPNAAVPMAHAIVTQRRLPLCSVSRNECTSAWVYFSSFFLLTPSPSV